MHAFTDSPSFACLPPAAAHRRRARRGAFALVITLLILSLLIIVVVSYLSSMVGERQTADAYTGKARAEQVAQSGVDSAMAILTESFRDFPDSATAWDTQQSTNSDGTFNEGTSLYLRAASTTASLNGASSVVADPKYTGAATPANDLGGNNPNNPACKNFVLPLVSGVIGGRAQLLGNKNATLPALDPSKQNFAELNIRRFAGDTQGVIGSPPSTPSPGPASTEPKRVRAPWVDFKDSAGRLTGRYAFWVEDESFRTNINHTGNATARADNTSETRSLAPKDVTLGGTFSDFDAASDADARRLLDTRDVYPAKFFPDPLAFSHAFDGDSKPLAAPTTKLIEAARYLTTTQSGSLNLTRHGTQRLNLNAKTTIDAGGTVTMSEIRKLVEAIRFHLPNFGQRFYRTSNPDSVAAPAAKSALLNNPTNVSADRAEIYLYKTAANLRDYVDVDDQPTMIMRPMAGGTMPTLAPAAAPVLPFGGDGQGGNGPNYMWAQGKEGAPFLQEAMVRYRPAVLNSGADYTLTVDYYVEFWNMSDHDVTAFQLGNQPFVRISSQQPWYSAYIATTAGKPSTGAAPERRNPLEVPLNDGGVAPGVAGLPRDFNMDLIYGVYRADNPAVPVPVSTGVVFKAGECTVITSDPDFVAYTGQDGVNHNSPVTSSVYAYGGQALGASGFARANVYYCSSTTQGSPSRPARRVYAGSTGLDIRPGYVRGIMPYYRDFETSSNYLDFEVEVTLGNNFGYIECATGAFCIAAGRSDAGSTGYGYTWTASGNAKNDYLMGGTLGGNTNTASEMGDPRTNNEQLDIRLYRGTNFPAEPDQYRYGSPGQTLMPPFGLGLPNSKYLQPATGAFPWPDYYNWSTAAGTYPPTANLNAANTPSVIANAPLTSIGQLGDLFDPARVIGTVGTASIDNSRGGGRTLKIGQRDGDRFWYDPSGNPNGNNSVNDTAASNGWAAWRLTDVFGIADPLELPARININGVARDGGAALRAALTGFKFQPQTTTDPLVHGAEKLAGFDLKTASTDTTGVSKLVSEIKARLAMTSPSANTPYGPFFERGELGELESPAGIPLFGKNALPNIVSTDLAATSTGAGIDLNHVPDRGREELFRRLVELICTRGDTFTVYAVGQSMTQTDTGKPAKITGTHRMRVTFRLVPKRYKDTTRTTLEDFHPGYAPNADGGVGAATPIADPDTDRAKFNQRFDKPDLYDVQVLETNTL